MKVVILNDTRGNHFGCELVMQAYHEQLGRVGVEVLKTFPLRTFIFDIPKETDLVIVNGEGSLHKGRYPCLVDIADEYPSVLLNTVWQNNPKYSSLYNFKYIAVRESSSYNALPPNLSNVEIVPDLSFSSTYLRNLRKLPPYKDLGFTDNVIGKNYDDEISALRPVNEFLSKICEYKRLCIGRFHGVVAASILQIPFSTWPSNTHKIEAMLTDMQVPHLHFETRDEALKNVPLVFDDKISSYVRKAQCKIDRMFENLHNLV